MVVIEEEEEEEEEGTTRGSGWGVAASAAREAGGNKGEDGTGEEEEEEGAGWGWTTRHREEGTTIASFLLWLFFSGSDGERILVPTVVGGVGATARADEGVGRRTRGSEDVVAVAAVGAVREEVQTVPGVRGGSRDFPTTTTAAAAVVPPPTASDETCGKR